MFIAMSWEILHWYARWATPLMIFKKLFPPLCPLVRFLKRVPSAYPYTLFYSNEQVFFEVMLIFGPILGISGIPIKWPL